MQQYQIIAKGSKYIDPKQATPLLKDRVLEEVFAENEEEAISVFAENAIDTKNEIRYNNYWKMWMIRGSQIPVIAKKIA